MNENVCGGVGERERREERREGSETERDRESHNLKRREKKGLVFFNWRI